MKCFSFISVRQRNCPWASANISSLFIIETLSSDQAICGVKDGCNMEYRVLERHTEFEVKVTLPRNEVVYLSGPCQLNICLRDILRFMKTGVLKNLGEGHPCLALAQW